MSETSLELRIEGPIARLTLTSPSGQNPIGAPLTARLAAACETIAGDSNVRAVLLTAEGKAFSTGWDWAALAASAEGGSLLDAARGMGMTQDPFGFLSDLPRPVICAVNGDALGAGFELALACDIRIAAEGACFGLPEAGMGILPMAGGIQRLARLAGRGKALHMLLSAEPIDAAEALSAGIVNKVVPAERVMEEAEAIAARIAERGPLAVAYAKEAVTRGLDMPLEQALRYETDLTLILQTTEDRAEGVRAFLEKRKPEFKGK